MSRLAIDGASGLLAYALGAGLVFVPLVGIPARFAFQGLTPPLVYAGTFLLGALLGALFGPRVGRT